MQFQQGQWDHHKTREHILSCRIFGAAFFWIFCFMVYSRIKSQWDQLKHDLIYRTFQCWLHFFFVYKVTDLSTEISYILLSTISDTHLCEDIQGLTWFYPNRGAVLYIQIAWWYRDLSKPLHKPISSFRDARSPPGKFILAVFILRHVNGPSKICAFVQYQYYFKP